MSKYSSLLNANHGSHVKVCLKTLYKIQIHMVINGNTIMSKVLHNIINPVEIMLGKIIHNSLTKNTTYKVIYMNGLMKRYNNTTT